MLVGLRVWISILHSIAAACTLYDEQRNARRWESGYAVKVQKVPSLVLHADCQQDTISGVLGPCY